MLAHLMIEIWVQRASGMVTVCVVTYLVAAAAGWV